MIKLGTLALVASSFMALATHAATLRVTVVDVEGTPVEDAVVAVALASGATPKTAPGSYAVIRQEKMQFVPKVTLVTLGTKLQFVNLDSWDHHVRGTTGNQFGVDYVPAFSIRQGGLQEGKPPSMVDVSTETTGPLLLGCHLHSSMTGYVYVTDSPWATKTTVDGVANLENLPVGDVKVTLWQANEFKTIPVRVISLSGTNMNTLQYQLGIKVRKRKV